ncbi:hypothetical protein NA78x_001297 [Anatilimnocola sp. NA78]|uniref:hypothetical protein n=1 Tax=Anatilimnocola sp. NA78 TaxID=3415683 RepID=UPI003CE5B048
MNAQGWVMMIMSVGSVLTLTTYCLYRVLTLPPAEVEDLASKLTIEPTDIEK